MESHFANVNNIKLHYLATGKKGARPLMLFLHGFPEYSGAWHAQLAEFGADFYAVAPDLRGFNLSDKPGKVSDYRIESLMGDIAALITHLGYTQCILVAHDWGGAVAWAFATHYAAMVQKLVILNAPHTIPFAKALASDPAQQAGSQYMLRLRQPDAAQLLLSQDCARLKAMLTHPVTKKSVLSETEMTLYQQMWQREGAMDAMLNYYRASPIMPPSESGVGAAGLKLDPQNFRVLMPTLIIWGMRDQALLPILLEGLDALIPNLKVIRVPEASHWIAHEMPKLVNQAIREFVGG